MATLAAFPESSLNPNAPDFFPESFKCVEDFSAEWWYLIQASPSFREFWTRENGELEQFTQDDFEDDDEVDEEVDEELPEEDVVYESVLEQYAEVEPAH